MASSASFMTGLGQSMASSAGTSFANSAGSGLGDAIFGGIKARRQWKYTRKQMALQQQYALEQMAKSAEYQLTHDKEMFDYENAYNEPSKVFQRFLEAGVNPAAALGQSGASVGATVPTGSGGSPSGSAPSGGSGAIGSGLGAFAGDPNAIARNMLSVSEKDRNEAAAERDRAEASKLQGDTHTKEWRADMDALAKDIESVRLDDAKAILRIHEAQGHIYDNDALISELTFGSSLESVWANTALLKEQYLQLKDYNLKYFNSEMTSSILLNYAMMFDHLSSAENRSVDTSIKNITRRDLENWFSLNWERKMHIPRYDDKGRIVGYSDLTGAEIHQYLLALDLSEGDLQKGLTKWRNRSEKNALGYSLLRTLVGGLAAGAGMYMTKGLSSRSPSRRTSGNTEEYRESYDRNGEFIGGTRVTRRENW